MENLTSNLLFAETTLSLETLTAVLGWTTVINLGLLIFGAIMLYGFRSPIKKFHTKISGLTDEQLDQAYLQYLAHYKILFLIFNLTPYLAIRLFIL